MEQLADQAEAEVVEGDGGDASFLGKAGPLVLARLLTAFLTLSIPLVLVRVLKPDAYGTYKQLFLVSQTLSYVLPFGMAQALYFFIPRSKEKRPYLTNALSFMLVGGVVAGALLFFLGGSIARYASNPTIVDYRLMLALYTFLVIASCPLEIGLTSQGKTKASAIVYLATDSGRALVMVVPVLLGYGLQGVMTCLVVFTLVRTLATWRVLLKGASGPFFRKELFLAQLRYALPFGAAMLLAIPQQYAHQYAVMGAVTPALFALYSVGCFQLPIVDLLYTPTSEVLMVRLGELEATGRMREALAAFRGASAKLALVFFPLAAFLFAAAPEFIGALFGPKFLAAIPIFRVSVCGILLATLPLDGVLRASNQTRHIFLSYLFKTLATLPLVYFGVRAFGMMGGIGSWAIAEYLGKLFLISRVPHALSVPERRVGLRHIIPWRDFGRALGAAAMGALAVLALRWMTHGAFAGLPSGFFFRMLPLGADAFLFFVAYVASLWLAGVRPMDVLNSVRRRAPTVPSGAL